MKYLKIKSQSSTYIDSQYKNYNYCNEVDIKFGSNLAFKYVPFINFGNFKLDSNKRISKVLLILKTNRHISDYNFDDFFLCTITEEFNSCEVVWNSTPKENVQPKSMYKVEYYNNSILIDITNIYKTTNYINESIYGFSLYAKSLKNIVFISNSGNDIPYINICYNEKDNCNNKYISNVINEFEEKFFNIKTDNNIFYTKIINISHYKNASFFVKNNSSNSIFVSVEISPDGVNFAVDSDEKIIFNNSSSVFVIARFLKYTRLRITNQYININKDSDLDIWFQGQKSNYKIIYNK